jgi:hypothetical protein
MAEILDIKKALERRLASITPSVPTGYENVEFNPPVDSMYQRCQFIISQPEDTVLASGFSRERLQMQVFIADMKGKGTAGVIARAELVRATFAKGLSLVEGTTRIHVLKTPHIGSVFPTQDRILIPVIINVIGEVYS